MEHLLIQNIGLLATPEGHSARAGAQQGEIRLQKDAWILIEDGKILATGSGRTPDAEEVSVLDAGGRLVTPGLVDAHTHLIFGGWRQNELEKKLHGASYLDILAEGGGILSTVRATRQAPEQTLYERGRTALAQMLRLGVTTAEAKSGYGLDLETELKMLRVIRRLDQTQPVSLAATYLGAHAMPEEYAQDRAGYIRLICQTVLPAVRKEQLAEFCDVFCETGAFTVAESEQILLRAQSLGLKLKVHADEIDAIGASELAGRLGAISAEHLIVCRASGIEALRVGGSVACCLPATSLYLGADFAPARSMVDAGVPIALASDFNPGSCPSLNLQLVMNLACLRYRLTPEQALTGVTLNAAAAICRAGQLGSIEPGKAADLTLWDAQDLAYIFYRMGSNLVSGVVKQGRPVF